MIMSSFRSEQNLQLPPFGEYASGIFYLDKLHHQESEAKFSAIAESLSFSILGWRTVPTNNSGIGAVAKNSEPFMRQVNINLLEVVYSNTISF